METYAIRIKGHLSPKRQATFAGLRSTLLPTGETLLEGPVADQAALHGILRRISDLGITLELVEHIGTAASSSGTRATVDES